MRKTNRQRLIGEREKEKTGVGRVYFFQGSWWQKQWILLFVANVKDFFSIKMGQLITFMC